MYPSLTYFRVPPQLPSTPAISLQKKTNKQTEILLTPLGKTCSPSSSVHVPFHFCFTVMSYWSLSRSLDFGSLSILDSHWDSTHISGCCPESQSSCSYGSTRATLLPALAAHRWDRCWGIPIQLLNLCLNVSWVFQPTSTTVLIWPGPAPFCCPGKGQGQFRVTLGHQHDIQWQPRLQPLTISHRHQHGPQLW